MESTALAMNDMAVMTVEQVMAFLNLKKPTVYLATCKGRIPVAFRKGRRIFILRSEVDRYIAARQLKTTINSNKKNAV
jgi:excisionase family DNA binding protein